MGSKAFVCVVVVFVPVHVVFVSAWSIVAPALEQGHVQQLMGGRAYAMTATRVFKAQHSGESARRETAKSREYV
jgi:hypothetical protein